MDTNLNSQPSEPVVTKDDGHGRNIVRLVIGLVIIAFGLVTLARTTGYMDLQFRIAWQVLWPVIIVVVGLSLISRRGWVSNVISAIATIFVIWVVALMLIGSPRLAEFGAGNNGLSFGPWSGLNQIKGVSRLDQVEKCLRLIGVTPIVSTTTTASSTATTSVQG